jgi:intracellular sulfur oxidation DsrE/DsrF family protein
MLLLASGAAGAATLDGLLAGSRPPGVVIEVLGPEEGLREGIPRLRETISLLRERFPALDIAVVSHGREQFALLEEAGRFADVQQDMRQLIEETQVNVHVCGANAERAGKGPEDFVAFVDVAAHGPRQIRDYEALGYVRLKIILRQ